MRSAVSLGAGAFWLHVYDAVVTKARRYVQGGGCATVGVAGLIQSGGFGSFSRYYGTAAASLLEAEVVTADGAVHIANACTNPDLFWALKGGGGGSFGIVTRLTLKTHELAERAGAAIFTIKAMSGQAFRELIVKFVGFYAERLIGPNWGGSIDFQRNGTLTVAMLSYGLDKGAGQAVWQPFLDGIYASPQRLPADPQANHRRHAGPRLVGRRDFARNTRLRRSSAIPGRAPAPATFPGPPTTTRSARSGAASRRSGSRQHCSSPISSSGSPMRSSPPPGIARLRSNSLKRSPGARSGAGDLARHSDQSGGAQRLWACTDRELWAASLSRHSRL